MSRVRIFIYQDWSILFIAIMTVGALGHIYAVSGRVRDAQNSLRMLDELTKKIYVSPYEMAVIYVGLGEQDRALELIEKAYRERSLLALSVQFDPRLNKLREDPRFQDFMRRTGIPL